MTKKPSPEIEKPGPCPWCGSRAPLGGGPRLWRVACAQFATCGGRGPYCFTKLGAIRAWNRVSRLAKRSTRGKGKRK